MLSLDKREENHEITGKANYFQQNVPKIISSLIKILIKTGEWAERWEKRLKKQKKRNIVDINFPAWC